MSTITENAPTSAIAPAKLPVWASLFSLIQIFIVPIFTVVMLAIAYKAVEVESGRVMGATLGPSTATFLENKGYVMVSAVASFFINAYGELSIAVFGVFAACRLRALKPGAVKLVKVYLCLVLGWAVLGFGIPVVVAVPAEIHGVTIAAQFSTLVRAIIFFAVWLVYFSVSKTIRGLFPNG